MRTSIEISVQTSYNPDIKGKIPRQAIEDHTIVQVVVIARKTDQIVEDSHLQGDICPRLPLQVVLEHSISIRQLRPFSRQFKSIIISTSTTKRNISTRTQRSSTIPIGINV